MMICEDCKELAEELYITTGNQLLCFECETSDNTPIGCLDGNYIYWRPIDGFGVGPYSNLGWSEGQSIINNIIILDEL